MNVAVFCASNDLEEKYTAPAKELARLLAAGDHTLIYGGSDYGLMRVMGDGVRQGKGKLVGITIEIYAAGMSKKLDEKIMAKNLGERKAILLERADAIVVLVGGLGTLDEITEILELKKQGRHNKAIVILNTGGFYDGLRQQLERMAREGQFKIGELHGGGTAKALQDFVHFASTPAEVMALLGT